MEIIARLMQVKACAVAGGIMPPGSAAWLGVQLDEAASARGGPRFSASGSRVSAWAGPTNEELMIARQAQRRMRRN